MFDIFYIGNKPNLFSYEKEVTSVEEALSLSRTRFFWLINYLSDYSDFDFLWEPVPWEAHQRHAWPSQWQKDSKTYLVPKQGFVDTNYSKDNSICVQSDLLLWEIPDNIDKSTFDFTWHPDSSEQPYIYQFATQHQKTGGPRYAMPGATEVKYISHSHSQSTSGSTKVYLIDHLNNQVSQVSDTINQKISISKCVRYFDNYLHTLKRIVNNVAENEEYIWVCSSVCDYSQFDFTWHPKIWQESMLHVFPSDEQKFGDTFFVNIKDFQERISGVELLEWFDLNFVSEHPVPRLPLPVIRHHEDSHVNPVHTENFTGPLLIFSNQEIPTNILTVPLWRHKVKTIVSLTTRGSTVIVPREAQEFIKTQLYDYPYILKNHAKQHDTPLDIVFISNGETNAEQNWQHLQKITKNVTNRVVRVNGVNGRVAAYQAAATASNTPWFFAVFAKLQVEETFDWTWQPDCLQEPKHYIFHARNPVNGLEYGHMAMIAYNKIMTMNNTAQGLDFTLDQPHEVVPVLSGIAYYNDDPWMTWRTSFREVLKLKNSTPTVDTQYRLCAWQEKGDGESGQWSKQGAKDAVDYYNLVGGDFTELRKSYDWAWLKDRYAALHNKT